MLLVPPLGPLARAERPTIGFLADADNAQADYALAIQDLRSEVLPAWIQGPLPSHLLPAQEAYLGRHQNTLAHLKRGVSHSSYQFLRVAPTATTSLPDLRYVRALTNLAAAESDRLRLLGQNGPSTELALAAYRFGSDMAEPHSGLLLPMVSVGCRRSASVALFAGLGEPLGEAESYRRTARAIARCDRGMPTPYEAVLGEWQIMDRTVEDSLLWGQVEGPRSTVRRTGSPSGFRLRTFQSFMRQHQEALDAARPSLESWNFQGLADVDRTARTLRRSGFWSRVPFLADSAAADMLDDFQPRLCFSVRLLYLDRAVGTALQVFAASQAYNAVHGHFPEDLSLAMGEVGLPTPWDPVTLKPIGYRLDDGRPVVWLAGFDGRDDGGRRPYEDPTLESDAPGTDLLFRLGEMPSAAPDRLH